MLFKFQLTKIVNYDEERERKKNVVFGSIDHKNGRNWKIIINDKIK
jgi:hypothetical protein